MLYILGALIVLIPTIIDPKYFSRALTYWSLFSVILAIIAIMGTNFLLSLEITNVLVQIMLVGNLITAFF